LAAVPVAISADYGGGGGTPIAKTGELDCNGFSPVQQSIKRSLACTDVRGFVNVNNANTWGGRFYDNGQYIGHDEPDMTFYSSKPGSGSDVTWTETLGSDPKALPTVQTPGKDVTHWFQLSIAPWFSMDLCDPNSYPQMPCVPNSDANAPACPNAFGCAPNVYPGAGGAFMELQFYPPGFAPFADAISCDNKHWCAALNVDSLSCTYQFANCNNKCIEPINFAFLQTDGIPTGPPSPQKATLATFVQNAHTLLMNPGDKLSVHIFDAAAPGGGKALKTVVDDLTTHKTGFMQASAANGFQNTSLIDCSGAPFNYEPEYNTAAQGNIAPWTALQTNISTQFEIGHFEACTTVSQDITGGHGGAGGPSDPIYNKCAGPYESSTVADSTTPERGDAACFPKGDTHGTLNTAPNQVTGCIDNVFQNGDLDFDGSPYWADWPTGTKPTETLPATFRQLPPITNGQQYSAFNFQTDAALSESTCTGANLSGCAVPPPNAPGKFYPFWSVVSSDNGSGDNASASRDSGNGCVIEFGNVTSGEGVNSFGGDAQYGTNQVARLGYPEFESQLHNNTCQQP